jgi:hypothetical protein
MERRGSERLPLSCRVLFDINGMVAAAQTRNISSGGFYCLCEERLPVDGRVRCRIHVFRNEAANQNGGVLECLVRIVRVDAPAENGFGIACQIEDYILFGGASLRATA